jgi:tetratricopeptide (TPR) repeat protein
MKRFISVLMGLMVWLVFTQGINAQSVEMNSAKLYKRQGNIDKAIEYFEKAIAKKPENAEAHYSLAELYGQKGRLQEMVREMEASLSYSSKFEKEIQNLRQKYFAENFNAGVKAAKEEDYPGALKGFMNARIVDPKYVDNYRNLAFVYSRLDSTAAMIKVYEDLLAIKPDDYQSYIYIAQTYNDDRRKEYDKSIEVLRKGLASAPDSARARLIRELGITYDLMGKGDEAIKTYQEALQTQPDDKNLLFNLGYLYYRRDNYPNAISEFKKVLNLDSEDFDVTYHLGRCYLLMGEQQEKQAREMENEAAATKKKPNTKRLDSLRSVAAENFKVAKPYLQKAVTLKPDDYFAWHDLAVSYIRTGETAKGEEALKKEEELRANLQNN